MHSHVRVGKATSSPITSPITISRGVRQGSVLSPLLFLLVMDPLLIELKSRSCGPSVCGLYLGAFSHADDIHTLFTNPFSSCSSWTLYSSNLRADHVALVSVVSTLAPSLTLMISIHSSQTPSLPAHHGPSTHRT